MKVESSRNKFIFTSLEKTYYDNSTFIWNVKNVLLYIYINYPQENFTLLTCWNSKKKVCIEKGLRKLLENPNN